MIEGNIARFKELLNDKTFNSNNLIVNIRGTKFLIDDLSLEGGD